MTEHLCGCGRPAPDSTICAACGYQIDAALAEITAFRGLGYDLDCAAARRTQPRMTAQEIAEERRAPGVLAPMPLPYNPRVADAAANLKNTLTTWVRLVVDETGADTLPADTVTSIARWLRPWVGWLRHHPAGQDAHGEILDAVHQARRVTDRPPQRLYAGVCTCGTHLYARPGSLTIDCPGEDCDAVWTVEDRRVELLAALDDHLANSQQMARLVGYLGISLPDSTIRWWASEKGKRRILAHGTDKDGRPLYRLGEVVRTALQTSTKAS